MDPAPTWVEPRLELIGGRLIVGGSLEGSRSLAATLLADYGPAMALPLAPDRLWRAAIRGSAGAWSAEPADTVFARGGLTHHMAVRAALRFGLHEMARTGLGHALGPDFVMRLGDQGLTPDLMFLLSGRASALHSYYLDGPADLVIEITHDARAAWDRRERRRIYRRGRVPEYWIVDPATRLMDCFRLSDGEYLMTQVGGGTMDAERVAGLSLDLDALWRTEWGRLESPFKSPPGDAYPPDVSAAPHDSDGLGWDALPFVPVLRLESEPIQFEQFLAWCPEAKFERLDGRLSVASREGTRRTLALLMMTLGLREVVAMLPVKAWTIFMRRDAFLPAIEPDLERFLAQARVAVARFGASSYWQGSVPDLPIHVVEETRGACERALAREVADYLLFQYAMQPADRDEPP